MKKVEYYIEQKRRKMKNCCEKILNNLLVLTVQKIEMLCRRKRARSRKMEVGKNESETQCNN